MGHQLRFILLTVCESIYWPLQSTAVMFVCIMFAVTQSATLYIAVELLQLLTCTLRHCACACIL
jgi:hypothetical protein